MVHAIIPAIFLAGLLTHTAQAQLITEPLSDDQYHVVEVDDGVLRIDRQSGEITQCSNGDSGWICRLAADDRQAYEAEITRLDVEVERLTQELDAAEVARNELEAQLEAAESAGQDDVIGLVPGDQEYPDRDETRDRLNLPSDEELDAVMDTAEEAMRRFFGMVRELREDMQREDI